MEDCANLQSRHTADLALLQGRVTTLEKVFELTTGLHRTLIEMSGDNKAILLRLEHQGEALDVLVESIKQHEDRFDDIEDKMGTKDTVIRLHERIDELEKKDGKKAEKLLGQIKWLLISMIITGAAGVVWGFIIN